MNKVILTNDRIFMAVVGPSGCGKTRLIFSMLTGSTFQPKFQKIYFFYREYQQLYSEIKSKIDIEFVQTLDFELIKKLNNCLLIFDDSCEEIFEEKDFCKIAVSGRHKKVHVIFVKHNLFHQSKQSRTIDLNTTHYILFNSPRDVQQINYFGKQLNKQQFLKESYEKAISEPHGHLLIDLDPKTSDALRFCSNIVGPGPSILYIPSAKAVTTDIHNEREKAAYTKALVETKR